LRQEHCRTEREDHSEQDAPGGQGLCESSQGVVETPQRGIYYNLYLLREQDSFFLIFFTAVNHLADRTVPQIFKAFKEMYQYHLQHGFHITTVHADGESAPLKTLIEAMPGGPMINLASANKHVTEIERRIRVVKERCRATRHSLPFHTIPKLMTIHILLNVVKLLIFLTTKEGVSDTLSPKTIMSGETLDYKKHMGLQLGQYCQVNEEDNIVTVRSLGPRERFL
jgi:hypothetical protein